MRAAPRRRYCIVLADGTKLAVPPIDKRISREVRRQIYDAVLRRQPGLAQVLHDIEVDVIEGREKAAGRWIAERISDRPHEAA